MLHFDIYIRGFGPGREPGAERLARAFGLPIERARELVRSLPRVVKRGVPQPQIERYAKLLDEIGADCELRPSPIAPKVVIAIGTAAADGEGELEIDGSALTLPPPRDEPVVVSRFAGTLVQPTAAQPAPVPAGLFTGAHGPNDTLVESHPPGSLVAPHEPDAQHLAHAPHDRTEPFLPEALQLPPASALPALPEKLVAEPFARLDERAPDARVLQVHAPTLRTFDTLTETPAPGSIDAAPLGSGGPWAPALDPAAAGVRVAPPNERTQQEAATAALARDGGSTPLARPPARAFSAPFSAPISPPVAAPAAPASIMPAPIAAPVAPASIMPAPMVPEHGPPPAAASPLPLPPALPAEAWSASPQPHDEHAELRVDWSAASRPRVDSTPAPPVPAGVPLPPLSRQAALRAPRDGTRDHARPSLRPSARPAPVAPEASALPLPARWALRVGLGVSLFVIVGTLRQCRAVNDDIEQGLARWELRPSAQGGALAGAAAPSPSAASRAALGPIASEWMRSELNQFAGGDKDRARGLVQRLEAAGALSVHVGTITELGATKIAGELLVVLPTDAARRAAVLEVHQAMLRATFGGFAPPSRPEGDVLHVTL